jgi:flagellar basal body-associated protein FliL
VELILIMTNGLIFQSNNIPQEKKNSYGILMILFLMVIIIITGVRVIYSVISILKKYGKTSPALEAVSSDTIPREAGTSAASDTAAIALKGVPPAILKVESVPVPVTVKQD